MSIDSINAALKRISASLPGVEFKLDEPMRNHTSFKIGGPVRAMFFPDSAGIFIRLMEELSREGVMPLVIGNGTNLLADDSPLEMVVIKTTGLNAVHRLSGEDILAEAGAPLARLAAFACECGLAGLEFASGIPGTLGGAIAMNAGAYGSEIKDVLLSSEVFDAGAGVGFEADAGVGFDAGADAGIGADTDPSTGTRAGTGVCRGTVAEVSILDNDGHDFSYRKSRFSDSGSVVLTSVLRLRKEDPIKIKELIDEYNARRCESQPVGMASAGSAFKRPPHGYSAELIDNAGLRGFRIGGAMVSEKHAGFIVNVDGASFADVIAVIDHVRDTVFVRSGVELEPEIRIIRG